MANFLELDYVYNVGDTFEYRNAHVSVAVDNEHAVVTVIPEHTMVESELNGVLVGLQSDMLKKARMSLLNDCQVVLRQDGKSYGVSLMEDIPNVKEMNVIE
jgi:hypothetical protein